MRCVPTWCIMEWWGGEAAHAVDARSTRHAGWHGMLRGVRVPFLVPAWYGGGTRWGPSLFGAERWVPPPGWQGASTLARYRRRVRSPRFAAASEMVGAPCDAAAPSHHQAQSSKLRRLRSRHRGVPRSVTGHRPAGPLPPAAQGAAQSCWVRGSSPQRGRRHYVKQQRACCARGGGACIVQRVCRPCPLHRAGVTPLRAQKRGRALAAAALQCRAEESAAGRATQRRVL